MDIVWRVGDSISYMSLFYFWSTPAEYVGNPLCSGDAFLIGSVLFRSKDISFSDADAGFFSSFCSFIFLLDDEIYEDGDLGERELFFL